MSGRDLRCVTPCLFVVLPLALFQWLQIIDAKDNRRHVYVGFYPRLSWTRVSAATSTVLSAEDCDDGSLKASIACVLKFSAVCDHIADANEL